MWLFGTVYAQCEKPFLSRDANERVDDTVVLVGVSRLVHQSRLDNVGWGTHC
jgi:hypothetical protein